MQDNSLSGLDTWTCSFWTLQSWLKKSIWSRCKEGWTWIQDYHRNGLMIKFYVVYVFWDLHFMQIHHIFIYSVNNLSTCCERPSCVKEMLEYVHTFELPCFLVSGVIIFFTFVFCELVHHLILENVLPGLFRGVVLDFVSGGEATVLSWELITIFHEYGLPLWTICLFLCLVVKVSVSCEVDNFAISFMIRLTSSNQNVSPVLTPTFFHG